MSQLTVGTVMDIFLEEQRIRQEIQGLLLATRQEVNELLAEIEPLRQLRNVVLTNINDPEMDGLDRDDRLYDFTDTAGWTETCPACCVTILAGQPCPHCTEESDEAQDHDAQP